jgi:hypothetical protein
MAGIREEMLDGLIGRIYEAGLRPELWRAVLHEISLALGAAGATVIPARPDFFVRPSIRKAWTSLPRPSSAAAGTYAMPAPSGLRCSSRRG